MSGILLTRKLLRGLLEWCVSMGRQAVGQACLHIETKLVQ